MSLCLCWLVSILIGFLVWMAKGTTMVIAKYHVKLFRFQPTAKTKDTGLHHTLSDVVLLVQEERKYASLNSNLSLKAYFLRLLKSEPFTSVV